MYRKDGEMMLENESVAADADAAVQVEGWWWKWVWIFWLPWQRSPIVLCLVRNHLMSCALFDGQIVFNFPSLLTTIHTWVQLIEHTWTILSVFLSSLLCVYVSVSVSPYVCICFFSLSLSLFSFTCERIKWERVTCETSFSSVTTWNICPVMHESTQLYPLLIHCDSCTNSHSCW